MKTTHELLYSVGRCNQQTGCRVITQEYLVNGYAIILKVRMTETPSEWVCFIGLMQDVLTSQLTKVREFGFDFIRQYVSQSKANKIARDGIADESMPTETIIEDTKGLFAKMLEIADSLTKAAH